MQTDSKRCGSSALGTGTTALVWAQSAGNIEIVPVRGHIYLLAGAGANITLSVGPDGVFMVDGGSPQMTDKVIAAIKQLRVSIWRRKDSRCSSYPPPKPIRYLANTTISPDHTGGNVKIAEAGKTFTGGNVAADLNSGLPTTMRRFCRPRKPCCVWWMPRCRAMASRPRLMLGAYMKLSHFFNGEGVELLHMPDATTDGDSIVWFRGSDVIATGDIFDMTSFPYIDLAQGRELFRAY